MKDKGILEVVGADFSVVSSAVLLFCKASAQLPELKI
jgi:hypothetical protein